MEKTLPPLRRIVAIHDLSGVGKCSLSVALPVISATGVECACLPTAVLSTHTGAFTGYVMESLEDFMLPIARHWKQENIPFDGIYTGYLATPEQERQVEAVFDLLAGPETMIVVDPVMADNGSYYANLGDEMCQAFRRLCRRAQVITPNITEAALLAGVPYPTTPHTPERLQEILGALGALGPRYVAVTGVHPSPEAIGNLLLDTQTQEVTWALRPTRPGLFYGTGDLFASSLSALLVRGMECKQAVQMATDLVAGAIERTALRPTPRRFGVDFEGVLPVYIQKVQKAFGQEEGNC